MLERKTKSFMSARTFDPALGENPNERYARYESECGNDDVKHPWTSTAYGLSEPFRAVICGSSGSGKSTTAIAFVEKHVSCHQILLFSGCTRELLWRNFVRERREAEQELGVASGTFIQVSDDLDELPDVREFDGSRNVLVIVDDMLGWTGKIGNERLEMIWRQGRKHGVSALYLSQSFFRTNRFVRGNSDTVFLFKQVESDIARCHDDLPVDGLSCEDVKCLYRRAMDKYGFLFLTSNSGVPENKRIRLGLSICLDRPE